MTDPSETGLWQRLNRDTRFVVGAIAVALIILGVILLPEQLVALDSSKPATTEQINAARRVVPRPLRPEPHRYTHTPNPPYPQPPYPQTPTPKPPNIPTDKPSKESEHSPPEHLRIRIFKRIVIPKELFKKIRRLEIRTKGVVNNVFGGEYHSAFKGRGIEFAEVRPYQVGDDIRNIDWNVSARMDDTYVKVYEEEREQTVMLLVDISGSGDFGSQEKLKRDVAAEVCAVMAFSAVQNNDKVGLLLFTDQVELFVPPKKGRRHVLRLIRELYTADPDSRGTDIGAALRYVTHVVRRRSILITISDFLDDGYDSMLRAVARRHDTVAVELIDPRETELPDVGLVDLTDAETGETVTVDARSDAAREAFQSAAEAERERTAAQFRRSGVGHVRINTGGDFIDPLAAFFRRRNRRA